uniref:Secreted protein n=1 Tax=Candidozyma auris TaxID=498019 RepID=A0A0L0NSU6_CANAR
MLCLDRFLHFIFFFFFFFSMCQAQLVKLVVRNLASGTSKTSAVICASVRTGESAKKTDMILNAGSDLKWLSRTEIHSNSL